MEKIVEVKFSEITGDPDWSGFGLTLDDFNPQEAAKRISEKIKLKIESRSTKKCQVDYEIQNKSIKFKIKVSNSK